MADAKKQQWAVERKHKRHRADHVIKVRVPGATNALTAHAHCTDISAGGLALYLPLNLAPGSPLELDFGNFTLHAVVRNANQNRYGLEFSGEAAERLYHLRQICPLL